MIPFGKESGDVAKLQQGFQVIGECAMPLVSAYGKNPAIDERQSELAMKVRTGAIRGLSRNGLTMLAELTLPNGRRADLIGLDQTGKIIIIEIKSSVADYNSDSKWTEYKTFCDAFYFATHTEVPREIFPVDEGLIVADHHGCEIIREAENSKLSAPTRKALTLRIARTATERLRRFAMHEAQPGETLAESILAPES